MVQEVREGTILRKYSLLEQLACMFEFFRARQLKLERVFPLSLCAVPGPEKQLVSAVDLLAIPI